MSEMFRFLLNIYILNLYFLFIYLTQSIIIKSIYLCIESINALGQIEDIPKYLNFIFILLNQISFFKCYIAI